MVHLRQDSKGNFITRRRLPDDVRDEYGRRYGARHEAKFFAPASLGTNTAKQRFREWDAEVTSRIDAIRAELTGEGIALTKHFPPFEGPDSGDTPTQLFDKWVAEKQPARGTEESWRYVFAALSKHFKERSAASITHDEAQHWVSGLVTPKRSARTVDNNYLTACKTVFGWAADSRRPSIQHSQCSLCTTRGFCKLPSVCCTIVRGFCVGVSCACGKCRRLVECSCAPRSPWIRFQPLAGRVLAWRVQNEPVDSVESLRG